MADRDDERRAYIEFRRQDPSEVVEAIEALAARGDGSWVNIEPIIDRADLDAVKPGNPLLRLLSSRGPLIPFGTYVTASPTAKRPDVAQVGLQHGAGQRAVAQLAQHGIECPPDWVQLDDSPKRGMVFRVPDDQPIDDLVEWVLAAATALSQVRIREHWSAVTNRAS